MRPTRSRHSTLRRTLQGPVCILPFVRSPRVGKCQEVWTILTLSHRTTFDPLRSELEYLPSEEGIVEHAMTAPAFSCLFELHDRLRNMSGGLNSSSALQTGHGTSSQPIMSEVDLQGLQGDWATASIAGDRRSAARIGILYQQGAVGRG